MVRPKRDPIAVRKSRTVSSEKPKVTLTCEQCRQRKTRCDKSYPCAACQRSHLDCTLVHRHRLPRGRLGIDNLKDANLKDRVARLEEFLTDLQSSGQLKAVEQPERLEQKASHCPKLRMRFVAQCTCRPPQCSSAMTNVRTLRGLIILSGPH